MNILINYNQSIKFKMTTSKSPFDLSQTKRFAYGLSNTPRTDFNQINNLKRDLVNQTPKPEMFYQNQYQDGHQLLSNTSLFNK